MKKKPVTYCTPCSTRGIQTLAIVCVLVLKHGYCEECAKQADEEIAKRVMKSFILRRKVWAS
jgi:hypothetical protein